VTSLSTLKTTVILLFTGLYKLHVQVYVEGKGKLFPLQARLWPRRWVEVQLYSSMTTALEGVEWSAA